jgi:hypothetical protein
MTTYAGSALEATAHLIARELGHSVTLGEPDSMQVSTEPSVIWTQPEDDRYRFEAPRMQPVSNQSCLDRYVCVDVLVRAPGSERALLDLSDRFLAACDTVFGAQPCGWRIDRNSSGGGSAPNDGAWQEYMRILIRYDVIRDFFTIGAPLDIVTTNEASGGDGTAESGLFVEGPAVGDNTEIVQ